MPTIDEKRPPRRWRMVLHVILITAGILFLLPLVWMIATSLKPLDQTLQNPRSIRQAFFASGYRAEINGTEHEVSLFRKVEPTEDQPFHIVQVGESFPAGEMMLSFGSDVWQGNPAFSDEEKAELNQTVPAGGRILADRKNVFHPEEGQLELQSGRVVPAELVRKVTPDPQGSPLYLVREWREEDTDTRNVTVAWDPTRAWTVRPLRKVDRTIREIWANYPIALEKVGFGRSLLNTLFLCAMTVGGAVISSVLVAYGFAFIEFPGRKVLFGLTLATIMIPFVVVMVPVYLLYRELGWVGTFKPLWVYWWFGNAFFIFLLRQFFLGLPKDLLDAARIDGCSELEILWNVVVPLSKPAIAMVGLFTFLLTWKDFLGPLIYLSHESQFTLSLSLQSFQSQHAGTPWHLLMAASTVFSLPLIILFFLAMKTFIRGVTMSGIKG